jgi:lysyl-tRNA synthetase class 2
MPGRRNNLLDAIRTRAKVLKKIREFFDQRGFVEVTTPCLVTAPDPAVHLDSFETGLKLPGGKSRTLYLATSPEYHMKRLVAAGMERIYQIGPFFRNGELTDLHNPEFCGLEWYQTGSTIEECMQLTEELVAHVHPDLKSPFRRMTVAEALVELGGVDVPEDFSDVRRAVESAGIATDPDDSFDDLVNRALIERVEPALRELGPVFLCDYPAPMAALARLRPDRPWVAERFELFAGGLELCNGYGELTDGREQRERFLLQLDERRRLEKVVPPLDEKFLAALSGGMPECSGCALGVDRLVMLLGNKKELREVMAFPMALELT